MDRVLSGIPNLKITPAGKMSSNGLVKASNITPQKWIKTLLGPGQIYPADFNLLGEEDIQRAIAAYLFKTKEAVDDPMGDGGLKFLGGVSLGEVALISDVRDDSSIVWWHKKRNLQYTSKRGQAVPIVAQALGIKSAPAKEWVVQNCCFCFPFFDPKGEREERLFVENGVQVFNLYVPPKYLDLDPPRGGYYRKVQLAFTSYLTLLFPVESQRQDMIKCIADLVWGDWWDPHILLIGAPGCGKGLLIRILSGLVGSENSKKINLRSLVQGFDDSIAQCSLASLEEFPLSYAMRERCKRYNDRSEPIQVENKNVQAYTTQVWSSVIHTKNDRFSIKLDAGDRKFFVPDLNQVNLNKIMSEEELDFLGGLGACPIACYAIAQMFKGKEGKSRGFDRDTKTFESICRINQNKIEYAIEMACRGEGIVERGCLTEVRKDLVINRSVVEEVLRLYELYHGVVLGVLQPEVFGEEWVITDTIYARSGER